MRNKLPSILHVSPNYYSVYQNIDESKLDGCTLCGQHMIGVCAGTSENKCNMKAFPRIESKQINIHRTHRKCKTPECEEIIQPHKTAKGHWSTQTFCTKCINRKHNIGRKKNNA